MKRIEEHEVKDYEVVAWRVGCSRLWRVLSAVYDTPLVASVANISPELWRHLLLTGEIRLERAPLPRSFPDVRLELYFRVPCEPIPQRLEVLMTAWEGGSGGFTSSPKSDLAAGWAAVYQWARLVLRGVEQELGQCLIAAPHYPQELEDVANGPT